jgi:hypothetical protein
MVAPSLVIAILAAVPLPNIGDSKSWTRDDANRQNDLTFASTGKGVGQSMTAFPVVKSGAVVNSLIGTDRFYNAGFTGQGSITASVDPGHIWDGHETLGHISQFSHHPQAWGNSTFDLVDRHAT